LLTSKTNPESVSSTHKPPFDDLIYISNGFENIGHGFRN